MDKNELAEFIKLVKEMRFNQRRFKKSNKPEILKTLDPLENKVDAVVSEFMNKQQKLF